MKRRRNRCYTVSARLKQLNWALEHGATEGHGWLAPAKVCANARDGGVKFYGRSVERCQKSKTVSASSRFAYFAVLTDISPAGLTDYEVRDLNDEINKLLREKRHWENQIVALGGANYRRNVAMLDDDGKEVPGTKGYKCVSPIQQIMVAAD